MSETPTVSIEQRRAILQQAINYYTPLGYRVINQTDHTAQLVRPKQFSCLLAFLSLLCFGIGVLFYLFFFMAMKDVVVFIAVSDKGVVSYNGRVPNSPKTPTPIGVQFTEARDAFLQSTAGKRLSELWSSGSGGKISIIGSISVLTVCLCCGGFTVFVSALPDVPDGSTTVGEVTEEATEADRQNAATTPTIAATATDAPTPTNLPTATTQTAAIPGLSPVDVTVNLEQRDFTCTAVEQGELYYSRTCDRQESELVKMNVVIYGKELFTVDYISSTVFQFVTTPSDDISSAFLGFMATMPYDGATPEAARDWVESTLFLMTTDDGTHSTEFAGVFYELLGPPTARILNMGALE